MKVHIANNIERHELILKLLKDFDKVVFLMNNKTDEDFDLFDSIEDLHRQVLDIRQLERKSGRLIR